MIRTKCQCCDKYFNAEKKEGETAAPSWCPRCTDEYEAVRETMSASRCKFHACTSPMFCERDGKCARELTVINGGKTA